MPRLIPVALLAVLATGATAGLAAGASNPAAPAHVAVRTTKLGRVLVNTRGVTLYLFEKDAKGRSACSGACARAWPPLLTKGRPKAGRGVTSSKLGTIHRSDGTTQATYAGHPLYTFAGDGNRPGRTAGEGSTAFGAGWYVLSPKGTKIEPPHGS
jgi:predicted lipoprotein with Yx(FWY)xxD motif